MFLGRADLPGGIGGEVGVYVKAPGGRPLPDLAMVPLWVRPLFHAIAALGGDRLWWPDPEVQPEIDFTLLDPINETVLLRADPERTYWVNKWMEPESYARYCLAQHGRRLPSPAQYQMVFTVAGKTRAWTPSPPPQT